MSDWKPGAVALRTSRHDDGALAICVQGCRQHSPAVHWHTFRDGRPDWDSLALEGVSYRHLVVIDPTDREQVERLDDIYQRALDAAPRFHGLADVMQAALREFADPTPPKPDEPMGLGAVVEDAEGDIWLRDGMPQDRSQSGHWWNKTVAHEKNYDGVLRADWHAIAAVRVLSPGVTDGGAS